MKSDLIYRFLGIDTEAKATVDGPTVACSFQSYWCKDRAFQAGGGDEHHEWPKSLGGSDDDGTDGQHLLILCPAHHRRQHALIRTYVEQIEAATSLAALGALRFVRPFAAVEHTTAQYAVTQWDAAGRPPILGWPCDAAVLKPSPKEQK